MSNNNVRVSFTVSQEEAERIVKVLSAENVLVYPLLDENKELFLKVRDHVEEALQHEMA